MNNKVLLLGGSHAEIPLIKAIQKLGYFVITTGNNKDGLGHKLADKYISSDFSDKNAILELALKEQVSHIVSGCNDFALLSTAWVAEKLNLKGHDTYETCLNIHLKDRYRQKAMQLGIKTPGFVKIEKDEFSKEKIINLSFPLIVKPVDLTGGKGCKKCYSYEEVEKGIIEAFKQTRKNYVIIEEFIEGTNHGFTTIIQNKKVVFHFVDNEQHNINKYLVSGASTTHSVPDEAIEQLIHDCETIASQLNLVDGILHLQFILDKKNIPTILEITRRAPGDLYIKFVELATGINYSELIVKAEMGLPLGIIKQLPAKHNIVRHCIMSNQTGKLKTVGVDDEIKPHIKDSLEWWKRGDVITNEKLYKAGISFIYFDTEEEMNEVLPLLNDLISIKTEN